MLTTAAILRVFPSLSVYNLLKYGVISTPKLKKVEEFKKKFTFLFNKSGVLIDVIL